MEQQIYNLLMMWYATYLLFNLYNIVHVELRNIRRKVN